MTKLTRVAVNMEKDLYLLLVKEAKVQRRSVSNTIVYALENWFNDWGFAPTSIKRKGIVLSRPVP